MSATDNETKVKVGKVVPQFTLPASNGEKVSIKDFRGKKVVLYFYPKDMTPGCTTQSCDFRDYHGDFAEYNTEVMGISADEMDRHHKFIDNNQLPFLLLSDTKHKVSEKFGVWKLKKLYGNEFMGIERSTFLINEKGKLVKEWRKVRVKDHVTEVLEAVKSLHK